MAFRTLHLAALAALFPATAFAGPGDHIRAGDTTITPKVDMGFDYRSNIYRDDSNPTSASSLLVVPGLELNVNTPQNTLKLDGGWEIRKFLTLGADVDAAEQATRIRALDRLTDFGIRSSVDLLRKERVGLRLSEGVSQRTRELDQGLDGSPYMSQLRNTLQGGLRLSPGPALDIVPGAVWVYDEYRLPSNTSERNRYNTRNTYGPDLDVKWSFFPRTAVVVRADVTFNRWSDNDVDAEVMDPAFGESVAIPNSTYYKVRSGVQGRLSERVFLDLLFGYAKANYDVSSVADPTGSAGQGLNNGLLVNGGLRYVFDEETQLTVAYSRDYTDSFFTDYVATDRLSAGLGVGLGRFAPEVSYGIRFENYVGEVDRSDIVNDLSAGVGFEISDWASVSGNASWQQRAIAQAIYQGSEFDDLGIYFGAQFAY